jgi:uncharacterized repeat protein (TIGR01451 family)
MKWRLLPLALAVVVAGISFSSASAAAGPFGGTYGSGYFTNTAYAGNDFVFEPFGVNPLTNVDGFGPTCESNCNLAAFEAIFQARLFDPASVVDQGRAASMIDMMLGQPAPSFGGSIANGIAVAQANFATWENLMAVYNSGSVPGYSVQWNAATDFAGLPFVGWTAVGATVANDWANMFDCTSGQGCTGEVLFQNGNGPPAVETTVDFNANGQRFIIRQGCGCTTGDAATLAIPSSTINLVKSGSVPTLPVGGTMTYRVDASESTNLPLANVTVTDPVPVQFTPLPGTCAPGPCSVAGNTVTWSFVSPADDAVLSSIAGGGATLSVGVTAVAAGNNITNSATGSATDKLGNSLVVNPGTTSTTVTAVTTAFPALVGNNGDIHAGGGLCNSPPSAGAIEGHPSSASYSQYVLSSSGTITGFGSNNSPADPSLNLGLSGAYAAVCRQDLFAAAQQFFAGTAPASLPSGTYDISGWSGLNYLTGTSHICGTVNNLATIVQLAGTLYIGGGGCPTNSITLTAAFDPSPKTTPSLGIITGPLSPVVIEPSVTHVDAYLFSDATIDMCDNVGVGSCSNTLTINGFIMAQNILFDRLGPLGATGAPVAEQINLGLQIFLNPPQFFSGSVDRKPLLGQGERPPLY